MLHKISRFGLYWANSFWGLTGLWSVGLLCGFIFASFTGFAYYPAVDWGSVSDKSMAALLLVILFPFLLVWIGKGLSLPWLCLAAAALKAFSFAFSTSFFFCAVQGGWLYRSSTLFSSTATAPLFLYFVYSLPGNWGKWQLRHFMLCAIVILCIVFTDCLFIG